ncbi:glycerophosphodiester phosphodiesterase [Clostridium pasteurianum]|uniref:Glycerophosphoryl diester phosphodiesterase n=1 Tax=Clostridium pasteurianum BC1 TaxID=86416 RepID=R4K817_CLOPA|nr:glycerophosphodiester phosphodiesterase [Clostridium pasteurianum]AGK99327.1 glycerophosphoryl diester phosphodiesterase [Clostridium pasteurianum BC1]
MINENKINITAHAGCMGTEMDSIEAVEEGIKYGADIIEIDLNIDSNGNLVLCHDKPKEFEKYLRLEEVLEIIKREEAVLLNIDVKDAKVLDKLNSIILDFSAENKVFFTGLDYKCIIDNKKILEGTNYFINLGIPKLNITRLRDKEYLVGLLDELESLNIMGININYRFVTSELINACKERKMMSSVWTVDDNENMKRMIALEVNSITTKRVDVLKNLISEIKDDRG